jgi:dTMP kinase
MIITIEGPDGSGKSTQAKMLADRLGFDLQRFPDRSTPIGKLIDRHLKGQLKLGAYADVGDHAASVEFIEADVLDDALMFQAMMLANRMEVGRKLRRAHLGLGRVAGMVCDRYYQSGLVYGSADGLNLEHLKQMHELLPQADLNVLVHVPASVCVERLAARGNPDRYEGKPGFIEQVVDGYDQLWHDEAMSDESWIVVDGTRPVEAVHEAIMERYNHHKQTRGE